MAAKRMTSRPASATMFLFVATSKPGEHAKTIQASLGLPVDPTQEFHISIAGIAPAWAPHPKSVAARQDPSMKALFEKQCTILRHGDGSNFTGFNDDQATNWTTHHMLVMSHSKRNKERRDEIKLIENEYLEKKAKLEADIVDIQSLGWCNPVGPGHEIKKVCSERTFTPYESTKRQRYESLI